MLIDPFKFGGGADLDAFKTSWQTDNVGTSTDSQITIPTKSDGTYTCNVDWGDGSNDDITTYNDPAWTHTYPSPGAYTVTITGVFSRIYFNNGGDKLKLTGISQLGTGLSGTDQSNAFMGCTNLTSLPDDMTLDHLILGRAMFRSTSLTSLPSGMVLGSLTDGWTMFYLTNPLASLPDDMTLASLTDGSYMFYGTSLTSLPSGMVLGSLTDGRAMFYGTSLTSLPSGMVLGALTSGYYMFYGTSLTSLPSGMVLGALTDGAYMFLNVTINTTDYNNLWVNIEANNSNSSVPFHGGNSKTSGAGTTAKAAQVADHTWTVTDGGEI